MKDSPRISEERRKAIQQFAREHNFYPNAIGEALRHSRVMPQRVIGVIVPEFTHYYFSSILTGIEEAAAVRGFRIMVALSGEQYEREVRICENFLRYKVCGVIVSQAKDTKDYAKNRYNGYKDALLKHGLSVDKNVVIVCDNRNDAEQITPSIMSIDNPPDGFFAVNDDTAIGILYTVKHAGYRVPEDISICGFTNGQRAIACDPMLTTVEQRGHRVGEESAQILMDKVEGFLPLDKIEKRIVRTRLVIRGTTR